MSVLLAAIVAAVVGIAAALAAGAVFEGMGELGHVGFWGAVNGGLAALVVFTATLAITGRHPAVRRFGRYTAGVVLLATSAAVAWWLIAWGVPPLTLEGTWICSLMLGTLVAAFWMARRTRSDDRHDERR